MRNTEAQPEPDTPWGSLTTSLDGTIVDVNSRLASWCGRSVEALTGVRWKELLAPASRIFHETYFAPVLEAQGVANEVAFDLLRPDGTRFPVLVSALRRSATNGASAEAMMIIVLDASETRRHERALREARREAEASSEALLVANRELHAQHQHLDLTLRSIADAVVTTDVAGRITSMNPTAERLSGRTLPEVLGEPIASLGRMTNIDSGDPVAPQQLFRDRSKCGEWSVRLTRFDGVQRDIDGSVATIRGKSGHATGTVLVCRDVTAAHESARQLAFEATHDHLTQLLNRREFERRVALAAQRARGGDAPDQLLCLDLDQFKIINDTAGHAAGDQALVEVAALLRAGLRQSDILARLGGDEFGVLLYQCSVDCGERIAETLRQRLAEARFVRGGRVYGLTASVGLATLSANGEETSGDALAAADMACLAAKEAGRNRVHRFDVADQALRHRLDEMGWVSRIRRGLDEDRFALYFQPIVRIDGDADGERHGELLLRLRDDDGRVVPPGPVIAAAERYQQMGLVDRWVVRRAFAWLASVEGVRASINVSGQSFGDASFLSFVLEEMATHGFAASRICFEITETAAIADLASALRFIEALRARGVRFALDDFGVGLSSFSYLKALPVDYVKIDGGFVRTLCDDPVNQEIVQAIHRVAQCCRLQTVAEWVEDANVLKALAVIGVHHAQGWHIGRPEPIVDGRV